MTFDWHPSRYLQFGDARLRPALDLLGRVPLEATARRVVDLGCGPGNVTPYLRRRFAEATIVGVDSSEQMLDEAHQANAACADVVWQHRPIEQWLTDQAAEAPWHLIYSNAALHWVADHETMFPALVDRLAPGGVLAVQMPQSWHQPSHFAMRQAVGETLDSREPLAPESRRSLEGWSADQQHPNVAEPAAYHQLLHPLCPHPEIWSTEILHLLPATTPLTDASDPRSALSNRSPVLDWVASTALAPVLSALSGADAVRFLQRYDQLLHEHYPELGDGSALLPFRRLYLVARRP